MAASDIDINFVKFVHASLQSIEKDSGDLSVKIRELESKLQKAREQVKKLPGIEHSPEEQERRIEVLRKQLASKTELLRKYKNEGSSIFDTST